MVVILIAIIVVGREMNVITLDRDADVRESIITELNGKDCTLADFYVAINNKDFKKLSLTDKIAIVTPILEEMKEHGEIKDYMIDDAIHPAKIEVTSKDDLISAYILEEFAKDMN